VATEVVGVLSAALYVQHLYHSVGDWCIMALLVVVMAAPAAVQAIRHRRWRKQVMSAFR
jgi:hypothetical protein